MPVDIDTPQDRVIFIKSVASFMVSNCWWLENILLNLVDNIGNGLLTSWSITLVLLDTHKIIAQYFKSLVFLGLFLIGLFSVV